MGELVVLRSTLTVWVSARSMKTLVKYCEITGRTVSELCEAAIEEACLQAESSEEAMQQMFKL